MFTQYLINAVITASIWMLVGVGFALVFQVARFFHFAHGIIFAAGAYSTYFFHARLGLPLAAAMFAGIVISAFLGFGINVVLYRPLRRRNSRPLVLLLASLGIYIVLQNLISIFFGDGTKTLRPAAVVEGLVVLGARITPIQVLMVLMSVILTACVGLLLKGTDIGMRMRAVAENPELAEASGIDAERILSWTFIMGSALAGVAGILVALDVDMTPSMGMNPFMMGVVAMIVGGANSIPGVAFGALFLALAEQFAVWQIGSQWQSAVTFVILLVFLIFRPQGFMGKKVSKAAV